MRLAHPFAVATALTAACGSDADDTPTGSSSPRNIVSSPPTAPAPETGGSETPPDAALPEADAEAPHPPETLLAAVNTLGFTRSESPGVAPGFNLDDRVSDTSDVRTCRKPDFTSPEGEPGIDNQLATLVPLFEVVGIGAVEGLVQNSIKEGGLLIMLEAGDVNDRVDDPEITLQLRLGQGTPLLGTDGLLLSGQTFHAHEGAESSEGEVESGVEGEDEDEGIALRSMIMTTSSTKGWASRVSSAPSSFFKPLTPHRPAKPDRKPMIKAPPMPTLPQSGVIATKPATAPEAAPSIEALPRSKASPMHHANTAAAVAPKVLMKARAAKPLASSAEPALKPNQPTHSKAAPTMVKVRLCGGMDSLP
jgi:hypothetical protein